ncbi:MAG: hypothetical protein HZA54_14370 [Planctomycetes bacterium]|nr:hypothetical protein [Planctomycetota bacterium]
MSSIVDRLLGLENVQIGEGADWGIRWAALPEYWVLFLVIVPAVVLGTVFVYRRESRSVPDGLRALLTGLRIALLALLLAILFQPVLFVETAVTKETAVLMLIDDSLSMTFKDRLIDKDQREKLARIIGMKVGPGGLQELQQQALDELSRIDLVNRALTNADLGTIDEIKRRHHALRAFSFSSGISPEPALGKMEAKGQTTALGDAVLEVMNETKGQIVVALIVLSDGRSNSGLEPANVARVLAERDLSVPIFTIGVGNPSEPKDVDLSRLEAPEVALASPDGREGDFVNFTFALKSQGFEGEKLPVFLKTREGSEEPLVVAEDSISITAKSQEQTVTLRFKPRKPGEFVCTVEVPVQDGELIRENNLLTHRLVVAPATIRVLYIEGYPRWEYRYLKNAMLRDHSVEVQCLLQSSDQDFPQEASRGLAPLTEFPVERHDLFKYDVILMGDIDPNGDFMPGSKTEKLFENIVAFVEEIGGGFAMIAGTRSAPRAFRNTALARLLPVVLEDSETESQEIGGTRTQSFHPKLTPAGREHPVMRLDPDPAANAELWEDPADRREGLPPIFWFYPVRRAKPGATVLAVHPTATTPDGNRVLIAAQPYGRGRTLFLGTDEAWRFRLIRGDRYFYTFYGEVLRYLRGGRLLGSKRYEIRTDKASYAVADRVQILARAYDADYTAITEPVYPIVLDAPSGQKVDLELKAVPNKPGAYEGAYKPLETGAFKLWIGPEGLGGEKERAFAAFNVAVPMREFEDPTLDRATLEALARQTDGAFLPLHELDKLPAALKSRGDTISVLTKEDDLWDSPLAFLLILLVITVEWVLRKMARLI